MSGSKYERQQLSICMAHKITKLFTYFRLRVRISCDSLGDSEVIMSYRATSLVLAVFAGPLAAAVLLGMNWTVLAAEECIERPNQQTDQAGHWYYYTDRVRHRRCWYLDMSEVTASPPSFPDRVSSPNADSQSSWFSRFAAGLAQTLPSEPQQNSAPDSSGTAVKPTPPKHPKVARRERARIVPVTETTGAAIAEQHDQTSPQSMAEKDGKRPPQLSPADRQELFEDFLKWYMDKNIFGRP
jgi:hypothetical protein